MKRKLKNWHFIIFLLLLTAAIRYELFINSLMIFYQYVILLVNDFDFAINQLNFKLFDILFSSILLILIVGHLIFRKKKKLLKRQLDFTSVSVILLGIFFVFAPLATAINPDFQKNLSVTKLLPPFSIRKVIHLKEINFSDNKREKFLYLKNVVVKRSFNESIVFADSVKFDNASLLYYQKGFENEIFYDELQLKNGEPVISNRLYLLGTDHLGRDILSRLIYGTRISLLVGLGAVAIAFIIGIILGFAAGYPGGFFDSSISRFTDIFLAFPAIFFIILILALFGSSIFTVIFVLGFSGWMTLFKIVRGEVISIKNKDYFITANQLGLTKSKLLFKEILPVIITPVVSNLVLLYGNVILAEAALSYLGLGTGTNFPSWGAMIDSGQNYITSAWWMIIFPGLALFITLYTANKIGNQIKNYFNPRLSYD